MGDACDDVSINEENLISSIFPNPFSQETLITSPKEIEIAKVFNSSGKCVQTILVNKHKFILQKQGLSEGVYFITFEANGNIFEVKTIIIK